MDVNILTKEQLNGLNAGQSVQGAVLMGKYTKKLTSGGKPYYDGYFQSMGAKCFFKCWSQSSAFTTLDNSDIMGKPIVAQFNTQDYQGSVSIVLDTVVVLDNVDPSVFLEVRYDANAYMQALETLVKGNVSEKGFNIVQKILFTEPLKTKFMLEFAATSHHDNCKSGLLAHTFKVVNMTVWLLQMYPSYIMRKNANTGVLEPNQDIKDLIVISALLHDIGKTVEMNMGVYQPESIVTHNYLGTEFIAEYKNEIIENYSLDWYYNLIAVIQQHHGEWGARPKTVYAYIIHQIDNLEAKMENLGEALLSNLEMDNLDSPIRQDDYHLVYNVKGC